MMTRPFRSESVAQNRLTATLWGAFFGCEIRPQLKNAPQRVAVKRGGFALIVVFRSAKERCQPSALASGELGR